MKPSFELDFRKQIAPLSGGKYHERIAPPKGCTCKRRGLHMPVEEGAVAFMSRGRINDAAGSLEIVFQLDETPTDAALVQAFGQYAPLVRLAGEQMDISIYDTKIMMLVRWQMGVAYRLRLSWDHTAGVVAELKPGKGDAQRLTRRMTWRAFRQHVVPFGIGGMLGGRPVYTEWTGSFRGWVREVRTWDAPIECPALPAVAADLPRGKAPFKAHRDVTLLALHDLPIMDSRWRTHTIPHRLDDLKKTRRVAKLDRVVAGAHDELAAFAKLTYHISRMWPHTHYWPWPPTDQRHIFWKRGHEMIPKIKAGEMTGMCGGYTHVMEECFWSLGFDARRTQIYGHSTFEAYSNQYDKWMVCDASFNRRAHFVLDAGGAPLGVRDLVLRHAALERDPEAIADVTMACVRENGTTETHEGQFFAGYSHVGVGLGDPNRNQGNRPHIWYFLPHDRGYFHQMDVSGRSTLVDTLDEVFWSCQRAQVALDWSKPGAALRVKATAFQTAFPDGFERRIDEGDWEPTRGAFTWPLHAGVNALAIRTKNKLGATGHPWHIQLWKKP